MALEVPAKSDTSRLLPQLWSRERVDTVKRALPKGILLPHCSLSGEDELPAGQAGDLAVVVCFTSGNQATALMSMHLQQWQLTFVEALRCSLKNLQDLTKSGPKGSERWGTHPSGCGTTKWLDGSDSARCALMPSLCATRKRAEGDEGGVVAVFASSHIVLTAGSKNPLGLCYAGDVANLQVAAKSTESTANGSGRELLLCAAPWRLVKALADPNAPRHPLRQAAGPKPKKSKAKEEGAGAGAEGVDDGGPPPRVWKWIPYEPGTGEFSVPRDQSEVDAVLAACEARQPVPVFGGSGGGVGGAGSGSSKVSGKQKAEKALKLKDQGGERFLKGDFTGALVAYAAALQTGGFSVMDEGGGDGKQKEASKAPNPNPKAPGQATGQATRTVGEGAAAAAKCHANMAACLLKLGGEERAAKALRAALEASRLDPGYAKAYFRASQALEALGEVAAAAEAKAKADELTAADRARKEKLQAAKKAKAQKLAAAAAKEKENAEAAKITARAKEETKEQCCGAEKEESSSTVSNVAPSSGGGGSNTHTIKLADTSALDASLVKLGITPSSASMVSPFGGALGSSIGGGGAAPSLSLGGIPIGGSSSSGISISSMGLSGSTPLQPKLSAIGDGEFTLG